MVKTLHYFHSPTSKKETKNNQTSKENLMEENFCDPFQNISF